MGSEELSRWDRERLRNFRGGVVPETFDVSKILGDKSRLLRPPVSSEALSPPRQLNEVDPERGGLSANRLQVETPRTERIDEK